MKFDIATNGESAQGALDSQHDITSGIFNYVRGFTYWPLLFDGAYDGAGRRRHLHAL